MIRRQFIRLAATAGAVGITSLGARTALDRVSEKEGADMRKTKTVMWRVRGFTCTTCAIGLKVMLRQQKGVKNAEANYPEGTATVQFDPREVSEDALKSYIVGLGFTAEEQEG